MLAVGLDHPTSREADPLLHTHLVIANRVQGPDGRWTALDGRDLHQHRLAADAIYRATYQHELARTLGSNGRQRTVTATGSCSGWAGADTVAGVEQRLVAAATGRTEELAAQRPEPWWSAVRLPG